MDCVKALTVPISTDELEDMYKFRDRTPQSSTHLPSDLEQKNYDGKSQIILTIRVCYKKGEI